MEVWDVVDAVFMAFYRAFETGGEYYYIKRVFWDQTLVAHRYSDNKNYLLSWSIDEGKEVSFSPESPDEWQEVEETWQPVERSMAPELRAFLGIETPENTEKRAEKQEKARKNEERRNAYMKTPHKAQTTESGPERRTFFGEVRAKGENGGPRKIAGYAAVFNEPALILMRDSKGAYVEVVEVIAPGAFDGVLDDDVRALFNHDPNFILGRNTAGTLRLFVDKRGLGYEIEAPDTAIGRDLLKSIERGDISQSSFGFEVESDEWESLDDGREKRTITKVSRLYDVSPVTYPAYTTTEATARTRGGATEQAGKRMDTGYQQPDWYRYRILAKKRV